MRLHLLLLMLLFAAPLSNLKAQNQFKTDSLTRELKKAKTPVARYGLYKQLSGFAEPNNKYRKAMLLNAELSGDTDLQLATYRFTTNLINSNSVAERQSDLKKMLALAKENHNEEYQGWYNLYSAGEQFFFKNNSEKAFALIQEANTIAANNELDSLAFEVNGLLGNIHAIKGERLLQYKSYMKQLSLAEKMGDGKIALSTYWQIFWFYNTLKEFTKAKETALKIIATGNKNQWSDWIEGGHHLLTHYYTNVKEFETAKYYYNETNRLRKKYHIPKNEDSDLMDIYTNANDYKNILKLLQKDDIKKDYFKYDKTGFNYYTVLANCYVKLGKADSAFLVLKKVKEASNKNESNKWQYYAGLGDYYNLINDAENAAQNYTLANSFNNPQNTIDSRIEHYANLDTLFSKKRNYEKAYHYRTLWVQYKDSAATLAKEGDLVSLEIENENQRMEAETRANHNIQYMGITAGLASIFIILALLGVFSSSTTIIRGLGFFAFIFFFEFLILLFDNLIHNLTHGEPWKVLSIKIVLIGMLLPLHHYIEHKVVNHLLQRKKIRFLKWKKVSSKTTETDNTASADL